MKGQQTQGTTSLVAGDDAVKTCPPADVGEASANLEHGKSAVAAGITAEVISATLQLAPHVFVGEAEQTWNTRQAVVAGGRPST